MRLLKVQRDLEENFNVPFLDLSVHETIHKLIMDNKHKQAEQVRKDFKVPDRRYVTSLSTDGTTLQKGAVETIEDLVCCCAN